MFRTALARPTVVLQLAVRSPPSRLLSTAVRRRQISPTRRSITLANFGSRYYSSSVGLKKEEVEGRIMSLLQGFDKVNDPSNIKATAHFANDLGLDSLDTVEVVMAIEEEFSIEIPDKDADTIHSVGKAVEYIMNQPDAN